MDLHAGYKSATLFEDDYPGRGELLPGVVGEFSPGNCDGLRVERGEVPPPDG